MNRERLTKIGSKWSRPCSTQELFSLTLYPMGMISTENWPSRTFQQTIKNLQIKEVFLGISLQRWSMKKINSINCLTKLPFRRKELNNFQNQNNFHLSLSNHPLKVPTRTKTTRTGIFPLVHNHNLKIFSWTFL